MSIKHFIILCSWYSNGKRMALHYVLGQDTKQLEKDIQAIKDKCGSDVPISTHVVDTEHTSWKSVQEKDGFFTNVSETKSLDSFIERIKKDQILKGIDIAYYILSKRRVGHLTIEKLVYMCYADYLCNTGDKLFGDSIYAFEKGPVVESVYKEFHKSKGVLPGKYDYASMKSRILFSNNGLSKLSSIDRTLEKYGRMSSRELVALTHREGTPWDLTDKGKRFSGINDELILLAHNNEAMLEG